MEYKYLFKMLVLAMLAMTLCCAPAVSQTPSSPRQGLSSEELLEFVQSLPPLPGRIQTIEFVRDSNGDFPGYIGLLTESAESGWQVFVFRLERASRFTLEWKSGKLDDSFRGSSPDALKTLDLGDEWVLTFVGCAAHACPDVFSVLLYAPAAHHVFTATYIQGKITWSSGLELPKNRLYKGILNDLMKQHRAGVPAPPADKD